MKSKLNPMGRITRVTVHHEGIDCPQVYTMADVAERLNKTRSGHMRPAGGGGLGAGDIGYHFCIDAVGRIWECRPLRYQGAHAGNGPANRGNIGIELLGHFDHVRPTAAQKKSLENLLRYLLSRYGLKSSDIYTHREIKRVYGLPATRCPGTYGQRLVKEIRAEFRARGL